jgi:hypothetical protein
MKNKKIDGLVKSASVPLGTGLRCHFVVAAPNGLTPQFLRAESRLWLESFLRSHQDLNGYSE